MRLALLGQNVRDKLPAAIALDGDLGAKSGNDAAIGLIGADIVGEIAGDDGALAIVIKAHRKLTAIRAARAFADHLDIARLGVGLAAGQDVKIFVRQRVGETREIVGTDGVAAPLFEIDDGLCFVAHQLGPMCVS